MNLSTKAFGNHEFVNAIKKLFQTTPSSLPDDLIVHSNAATILSLTQSIEGKNIPVVIHLIDGTFFKATIVKVLNGAYLITEQSSLFTTKANLISLKEILSVSVKE